MVIAFRLSEDDLRETADDEEGISAGVKRRQHDAFFWEFGAQQSDFLGNDAVRESRDKR